MPFFIALCALFLGVLVIAGAVRNWDWFLNSRRVRARFIRSVFGYEGARAYYLLLGIGLLALGLWGLWTGS